MGPSTNGAAAPGDVHLRRTARLVTPVVLCGVVLAACSGASTSSSASTASSSPATSASVSSSSASDAGATANTEAAGVDRAHPCSIATPQQLSVLVGVTLTRTEESSSSCQYFGATGQVAVALEVEFGDGRNSYDAASGPNVTQVTGAGDSAFRIKGVPSGTDFDAVKDDVYLNLFVADATVDDATLDRIAALIFQQVGA